MDSLSERRAKAIHEAIVWLRRNELAGMAVAAAARRLTEIRVNIIRLTADELDAKQRLPQRGERLRELCERVRDQMIALRKAAIAIGFHRDEPGAAAALEVPHKRAQSGEIVVAARRAAKFLQPRRKAFFKETNLPGDSLPLLRSSATLLDRAPGGPGAARRDRTAAIRALKRQLAAGRTEIDLITHLGRQEMKERSISDAWMKASRVRSRKGPRPGKKRPPG